MKCPVCHKEMIIVDNNLLYGNRDNYNEYNCNMHTNFFGDKIRNAIAVDNNQNIISYMIQLDNDIIIFGLNKHFGDSITEIWDALNHKSLIKINTFIKINNPESIDEFNNICSKLNNLKAFS